MAMERYMRSGMSNGGRLVARGNEPLTNEALRAAVPSIFATEAHESRSARFTPIPTVEVLDGLRNEGFEPFFAQQSLTRVEGKAAFTKHMLRMRHRSLSNDKGEAFEIILVNANDGTSAYQMLPGFFRFVCANGLFVGDKFDEIKVRHSGRAMDDVIEGAYRVLDTAPQVIDEIGQFKALPLSEGERNAFATAALELRFPSEIDEETGEAVSKAPITADKLLVPARYGDTGRDLYTTFNVVQERAVRGGLRGHTVGSDGRHRRTSTREVKGIDQSKALNRALWTLAAEMAKLKAA